jgi:nitroreductase
MDAIEAIKSRTSVRKYTDRAIPKIILEDIADCGRLAPTGYNRQPWTFVVITDRELLRLIAGAAKYGGFIADAGACIAIFCEECETMLEDACAAAENMMIAAVSHGLGACWINSFRKGHSRNVAAFLDCPKGIELMVLLSIGYPADEERRPKKPIGEILKWNGFR